MWSWVLFVYDSVQKGGSIHVYGSQLMPEPLSSFKGTTLRWIIELFKELMEISKKSVLSLSFE